MKSSIFHHLGLAFILSIFCITSNAHAASFTYMQAPQTIVRGTAAPYQHSVKLSIMSTIERPNIIVVIAPYGTTTNTGSFPMTFEENTVEIITFDSLLPDTEYTVRITQTDGTPGSAATVVQTMDSFRTKPNPTPTTTSPTAPQPDPTPSTPQNPQPSQPIPPAIPPVPGTSQNNNNTTTGPAPTGPASTATAEVQTECNDGKDNDGDGKSDRYGVDINSDGVIDVEPDPSCFSPSGTTEKKDDVKSEIIPCTDKCTFSDIFRLLNNFIKFFFKTLLIPLFIIIVMYAGFKYITAEGNPSKIANIKKMLWHIFVGILLILCSWLIVYTIMTTLLNDDFKQQGVEFLGQ